MGQGRLLSQGTPEELLAAVRGRVWELELPAAELDALRARHAVGATLRRGTNVLARLVAEGSPGAGARSVEPSLEDAYLMIQRNAQANGTPSGQPSAA